MGCAGDIITIKDRIHQDWFELQSYPSKIKYGDQTLLRVNDVKKVVDDAAEAIFKASDCNVGPGYINRIRGLLDRLTEKINATTITNYLGQPYYSMPADFATNILISDINKLANAIHVAGYSLVKPGEKYGGCSLQRGQNLDAVNGGVLAYCEGVSAGTSLIQERGTKLEHQLGVHKNVIGFTEEEDGYKVNLAYTESGHSNWDRRQDGVIKQVGEYGLECEVEGTTAKCEGDMADKDRIREMAYFFSGIHDVDLLSDKCIKLAIDWAIEKAVAVVKERSDEAYKVFPSPYYKDEWAIDICGETEERYRPTRQDRIGLVHENISETIYFMEKHRAKVKNFSCTKVPYGEADLLSNYERTLDEQCRQLGNLGDNFGAKTCENDLDQEKRLNDFAARSLTRRCDPIPIIHSIEATSDRDWLNYDLGIIQKVCERAEDQKCLEEMASAMKRSKEGAKFLKMALREG